MHGAGLPQENEAPVSSLGANDQLVINYSTLNFCVLVLVVQEIQNSRPASGFTLVSESFVRQQVQLSV
jgi:hypothetical protein